MTLRLPQSWERSVANFAQLSAMILLLVGVLLAMRQESDFRRLAINQTTAQADVLASSVTAALAFDDRQALAQFVQAQSANPAIGSAAVYGRLGRRRVELARPGEPEPPPRVGGAAAQWSAGRVTIVRVAAEQGQRLGYVLLRSRRDTVAAGLARHASVGLLTVMGLLLLSLVSAGAATLQRRARDLAAVNTQLTEEMEARAKAEEALHQSQKMEALGRLTGGIAHDFNNLLQVIIGAMELIRRRSSDPRRVSALAGHALEAAGRGAALTRQLLAFSRTHKLDLKPLAVGKLVEGMRDLLVRTLGHDIELAVVLGDGDALVLSDRTQLELAVLNLAINARDAMPAGGRLAIWTRPYEAGPANPHVRPGAYAAISVADTGDGMSPETAAHAFDPFFTTKDIGKGTGLGLAQVYGVAHQAGGAAIIESAEGRGTTVTLLLPISHHEATTESTLAHARSAAPTADRDGALILVVDDEPEVRRLVRETLELMGHRVFEADGGTSALQFLEAHRPDLMLLDFAMPQMSGAQVADAARAIHPDLPVLFVTGHADTDAIWNAVGTGAQILRKPFDWEALSQSVDAMLRGSETGSPG